MAAFTEVCPNRIDLLHRHYRKICRMLVDMDEWGQILMSEVLLRYARSQFLAPTRTRAKSPRRRRRDKKLDLSLPSNEPSYQDSSNAGIQSIVASTRVLESEEEDSGDAISDERR